MFGITRDKKKHDELAAYFSAPEQTAAPAPEEAPKPYKLNVPDHEDVTRRNLAYGLVILFAVTVLVILGTFITGWITSEELKDLNIVLTPVISISSTALGFYFGSNKKSK